MKNPKKPFKSTHPVHLNLSFKCENCKKDNEKAIKSCRNHCRYCLYSKHVDETVPGDRESGCKGLMEPIAADYHAKKGYQIIHECLKCKAKKINKIAEDDNMDQLNKILYRQNSNPPKK